MQRTILGAMKILTIEDDKKISNLLKRVLNEAGYAVDSENNGPDGLSAITS
jgi:DNA-binding response OmpR family regulator